MFLGLLLVGFIKNETTGACCNRHLNYRSILGVDYKLSLQVMIAREGDRHVSHFSIGNPSKAIL